MKIKSIKPCGREPVYNMTVDKHHNYLVNGGVILKNCDALRYFCVMRTLKPEKPVEVDDYEEDQLDDYDEYMTGGAPSASYIGY